MELLLSIESLLKELRSSESKGFQISKRNGYLSSTWLLYKQDGFYYLFDINEKISFTNQFKYDELELKNEVQGWLFVIELSIS